MPLGFVAKSDDALEDDEDMLVVLDEFISKIATMLVSLLEGEQDLKSSKKWLSPSQLRTLKSD